MSFLDLKTQYNKKFRCPEHYFTTEDSRKEIQGAHMFAIVMYQISSCSIRLSGLFFTTLLGTRPYLTRPAIWPGNQINPANPHYTNIYLKTV